MASSVSVFGLALREVARDQSWKREERELIKREGGRRLAVTERLMVCLSSNPQGGEELLRKTARTAAQANADWYAVHVETPAESVQKISAADFRTLLDNINLAADMGAEVAWLKSPDLIKALIEFAQDKKTTRIVFVAERREGAATRCRPRGESPEMARPWPRIGRSCRPRPRPPARRRPKHPPTARPRYPDSPHASEPLLSKVKSRGWACAECRALGALRKSERPGPRRHQPS